MGITVAVVCMGLGGYALNPCRDLGPRLFTWLVYGGEAFSTNNFHFVVPTFAPFLGGALGAMMQQFLCVFDDHY